MFIKARNSEMRKGLGQKQQESLGRATLASKDVTGKKCT